MTDRIVTAVVVGDGPAGSALASALHRRGIEVVLIGPDDPWMPTYGAWADDVDELHDIVARDSLVERGGRGERDDTTTTGEVATRLGELVTPVRVVAESVHSIERPYLVFDNERLRAHLRHDVSHLTGVVDELALRNDDSVDLVVRPRAAGGVTEESERADGADRTTIRAELVIDATGWPSRLVPGSGAPMGWQTAWGVVLAEPPDGPLGTATLMDFSPPGGTGAGPGSGGVGAPTFGYAFAVADGWLVEETVLASPTPIEPELLRPVLARRLGWSVEELDARALRVERVSIPMGAPMRPPDGRSVVVPFGAAAGLAHPATGYQVATSLRLAGTVADAFVTAKQAGDDRLAAAQAAWQAVWPASQRRTRRLHDYGLDVLMRLDDDGVRRFFEAFFSLPVATWSKQMRSESTPGQIAGVMTRMFAAAPWSLRRRLMSGDLRRLAAVLRS